MPDSPAQSTNLQGQTLANARFLITNLLGSGGMADVYRAYDNRTKRDVAVKMPKLSLLADEEFVKRFDREIKIMVGLEHPHIVPVLFAGKHEEHTFAVFPYLTGGSLGDRIKNEQYSKPPTTSGDLHWLTQIAMALDHLHGQGLLHRDVKPDNILFDAEGKAYLSDFGIVRALDAEKGSKAVTQLTAANGTIGTPQYMALELLLAKTPYTGAIDQYALAVTVYQALTGDRPYNGTFEQIVFQQARTKPRPLADARPDLPPLVGETVHRALAKSAARRFASCIEFAQAVIRGIPTPTMQQQAQPVVGTLVSSGETTRAPTHQPTQKEQPRRAAGVSRRSGASMSPTPLSPSTNVLGSPAPFSGGLRRRLAKHWYFIGAACVGIFALALLLILVTRPEKRVVYVEKNSVNPSLQQPVNPKPPAKDKDEEKDKGIGKPPIVNPNPQPQPPPTKVKDKVELPVVEPKPKPKPPPVVPKIEKYITNSIGMRLVRIPAGKFTMGSPASEKDRQDDEGPQHEVHITKPFYMGVHEVTQAQYQTVRGTNPSYFSSSGDGKDKVAGMNTSNFPVERVSWEDAVEFCKKLSDLPKERAAGRVYRLPSEAEWEYTCRGGSSSYQVFHFGNTLSAGQANCYSDYPNNTKLANYLGRPTTVGSYQSNGFGVYDMHGNVWEWCNDWYDKDYYGNSPLRDPVCLTKGSFRVFRGGSWLYSGGSCRAADRFGSTPADRYNFLGFRLALVPSSE